VRWIRPTHTDASPTPIPVAGGLMVDNVGQPLRSSSDYDALSVSISSRVGLIRSMVGPNDDVYVYFVTVYVVALSIY